MALSLWQHTMDSQGDELTHALSDLSGLPADRSRQLAGDLVALSIGQMVQLARQRHETAGWHTALLQPEAILDATPLDQAHQALADYGLSEAQTAQAIALSADAVSHELRELNDVASLGDEGIWELVSQQPDLLAGQASDAIWPVAGLPELVGCQAQTSDTNQLLNPEQGMAELNRLLQQQPQESAVEKPIMTTPTHECTALPPATDTPAVVHHEPHHEEPLGVRVQLLPALLAVLLLALIAFVAFASGFFRPMQQNHYDLTDKGVIMTPEQIQQSHNQLVPQEVTRGGTSPNTPTVSMLTQPQEGTAADATTAAPATATVAAPVTVGAATPSANAPAAGTLAAPAPAATASSTATAGSTAPTTIASTASAS